LKIFKSIKSFSAWRNKQQNKVIGFVPTMGALHQGHLSLVQKSVQICDITIVTLFVNQLQFAPDEDFKNYPRNIKQDIKNLQLQHVDVILIPSNNQMYNQKFSYCVSEYNLSKNLEGKSRPRFFNGVTTVLCKLFNLVLPQYVYFGCKDIQQLYIIKKMVLDLNYSIKIIGCPTIRESNGLAMSSRNQYLSDQEKNKAALIYRVLRLAKKSIQEKQKKISEIKNEMSLKLLNNNFKIEYVSIADVATFKEINQYKKSHTIISLAVFYKNVRLIDNILI